MNRKLILLLIPLLLANLFCTFGAMPQAVPTQDISSSVNATLTAMAPTAQVVDAIPTSSMGTVMGEQLMFPASGMPGLRIVFFNADGSVAASTDTQPGQNSFFMDLPEGTYTVVAYSLGGNGFTGGLAGGYTQAVLCGLNADCADHSLIPITIKAGETLSGINPNDYYAPENSFPPMPK